MNLSFPVAQYTFYLSPLETIELPGYKGSTFRGAFGQAFKRLICYQLKTSCDECLLVSTCPYHYVFETSPPETTDFFTKYTDIPRPFVIEPPMDTQLVYHQGEDLTIDIVLIGRAIAYLPYFVLAFQQLGQEGIGKGRRRFLLAKVTVPAQNNRIVFPSQGKIDARGTEFSIAVLNEYAERLSDGQSEINVRLKLLTPCRLTTAGFLASNLTFLQFMKAILRRVTNLAYFHGDEKVPLDQIHSILDLAASVEFANAELLWLDWERYSSRQGTKMKMGGLVGEATANDVPAALLPWLVAGELLHVGKGATFGLGKYVVERL